MIVENEYVWRSLNGIETAALVFVDIKGVIRNINKGVTPLLGYLEQEIIGMPVDNLLPINLRDLHKSLFIDYIAQREKLKREKSRIVGEQRFFPATIDFQDHGHKKISIVNKKQQEVPIALTINEVWSDSDELLGFIAIMIDNTEQYTLQQLLHRQSTSDPVTGLINWQEFVRQFYEKQKEMLEQGLEYHIGILYFDIDYFKTLTHMSPNAGNHALRKVATWLLNNTRQNGRREPDIVTCRFVSDEFVVCVPQTKLDGAAALSRRLKSKFRKLNLGTAETHFFTTISIGVSEINKNTTLQTAMSQAANACRVAKAKGKNKIRVSRDDDNTHLELYQTISEALRNQKITLYAQKIVAISSRGQSIDNGRAHYEVLSRMEDGQGNKISPAIFIPAAEMLGLAVEVDMYVIEKTLALIQKYPDHEKSLSSCSINLSGASVSNEEMLYFIETQIEKSGINPRKLIFEVTETYQIQDNEVAKNLVSKLRELGCKFAFDDFGIGHSNYQSFSRLPVDIIKIDGYYTREVLKNASLRTDMEGMNNSAKSRGLEVVAEFAENKEIVAELVNLGIDYAQGYYFSKPIPMETLILETNGTAG